MPHHGGMTPPRNPVSAPAAPAPKVTRARGRPSRAEAETLRANVLDAALDAFIAHGFEAASMEGIARAAGVAKITLYRHFQSKDRLFVDVARRAQLDVRNSLGPIVERDIHRDAPLEDVLREIIDKLYLGYTDPRYLAVSRMVIAEAARFPKLGRALLTDSKVVARPLVAYLQHLKDSGRIVVESPQDAATQICGLASGAGRYVLVSPSRHPASRKRWVDSLVALFAGAWRVGGG